MARNAKVPSQAGWMDGERERLQTNRNRLSRYAGMLPGSGSTSSIMMILAPSLRAGMSARRIRTAYLSDQSWRIHRSR